MSSRRSRKGGKTMRVSIQAKTQVGAEFSRGNHGVEVAVRCRDNPNVRPDRLVSAHALKFLLLNGAEDLALHEKRHVPDFVKEKSAAIAFLELPDPLAHGPGKGPFFVTEELTFQERLGNCRTVHGQELLSGPTAVLMNRSSDEFFPRSALPPDEHVDVLIGDPANRLVDLLHGRTISDHGFGGGR